MSGSVPTLEKIRAAHSWKGEYERYLPLSRYIFRPLGFRLTWLAVRLGATSEAVSWLSAAVGLLGLVGLVSGREAAVQAGLVLLILFNLLDCVDGSIARAMRTENPYGRFLDSVCGGIIDLGFWAAVGVVAFQHPAFLYYPDGFGYGPLLWLSVGGAACLLAVTVGYMERTYDELLKEPWQKLQGALSGSTADAESQEREGPTVMLRHLSRNLRVRETHYVLLLIAWWIRAIDLLLVAYLTFYSVHVVLSLALYARRGRIIKAAGPGGGGS